MKKYPSIHERGYASNREKWRDIIFEADTKEGRRFDIILLWTIFMSALTVIAESVPEWELAYGNWFRFAEYGFTILFTAEYLTRLRISDKPLKYALSFWGIIDLLATLPTYLAILFSGPQLLFVIRIFRFLRLFRVLRLRSFMIEANELTYALKKSSAKIIVFFSFVMIVVVVMGTIMYILEPPEAGFTSIPKSIYWAIVTLTTVGYGDITPVTGLGQFMSAALMILGYAVIAVPTGIVSVEMSRKNEDINCLKCGTHNDPDARYCKKCGNQFID